MIVKYAAFGVFRYTKTADVIDIVPLSWDQCVARNNENQEGVYNKDTTFVLFVATFVIHWNTCHSKACYIST